MAELGGRGRFAAEALLERLSPANCGLRTLSATDLELRVERLVDPGEAAGADQLIDPVLPEGSAEVGIQATLQRSLYRGAAVQ